MRNKTRIEKLEKAFTPATAMPTCKLVTVQIGETREAAFKRYGFDPDAKDVLYIVKTYITPQMIDQKRRQI